MGERDGERQRGGEGRERRTAGELGMHFFTEVPASGDATECHIMNTFTT